MNRSKNIQNILNYEGFQRLSEKKLNNLDKEINIQIKIDYIDESIDNINLDALSAIAPEEKTEWGDKMILEIKEFAKRSPESTLNEIEDYKNEYQTNLETFKEDNKSLQVDDSISYSKKYYNSVNNILDREELASSTVENIEKQEKLLFTLNEAEINFKKEDEQYKLTLDVDKDIVKKQFVGIDKDNLDIQKNKHEIYQSFDRQVEVYQELNYEGYKNLDTEYLKSEFNRHLDLIEATTGYDVENKKELDVVSIVNEQEDFANMFNEKIKELDIDNSFDTNEHTREVLMEKYDLTEKDFDKSAIDISNEKDIDDNIEEVGMDR